MTRILTPIKIEININSVCELRDILNLIKNLRQDNPNETLDVSVRVAD